MQRRFFKNQTNDVRYIKKKDSKNRYWKTIYCNSEKLFIGISYTKFQVESKVNSLDWEDAVCAWRAPEYKIDFTNHVLGQEVYCPKCGSKVDFRVWLSAVKPNFVYEKKPDDQKDNADKLSGS